ncbi:MAG: ssDNA endodeoxyribonuclease [Sclerophora amabilis]|nr:MAG: ssDNA endodeoxyribonuclease [Sclerophora amabilis]
MSQHNANASSTFSAVSGSARQLFLLLRCIGFASKAQVQITKDGLKFTVEESRVMQGFAFLEKTLFTTFSYTGPPPPSPSTHSPSTNMIGPDEDDDTSPSTFQIQLPALLETLQIFGADSGSNSNFLKDRWSRDTNSYNSGITGSLSRGGPSTAFDSRVLGLPSVCRLSYTGPGSPFCIILEEAGVVTTCELVTYEPELHNEIPLQRDKLAQKIIMRASWLHDAITELSSTSPIRLTITASPSAPFFALSASGPLGSATVEFSKDPQLLETFQVPKRVTNAYKFSLVKGASRAMALASKVSVRGDEQGVLSLQFMIEVESGGVSFVDFRFAPLLPENGEDDEDEEEVEEEAGED